MSKKKEGLVVKANSLVEAGYRLDLVEQRIILLAITEERQQRLAGDNEMLTVTAADYAEVYGVAKNKAYEEIKEALDTLWRREVTVYADHTGKLLQDPIKIRWIISLKPYAADGTISFEFHPKLKPYLAVLKENFTRHTLGKVSRMTSLHAIRLYELLLDWGQDFRHHHKEVEISWLKKIFTLEDQYSAIKDFKKYVLDIAIKQINENSNLICSYTQRKTGRNVTHLTFNFDRKPEAKAATEPKTKPVIKRATKPTVQSAAPNPTGTSKEVKQALRELLAARKKITPPEIKTKPEPPPATSSPARSLASIMNEIVPTLQRGNDQALAPGF